MRSAIIFLVLMLWPLSLPSAANAGPMSLFGPFDQTHNGQRGGPARSVTLRTFTRAVGGAATATRQLVGARLICVEGRLSLIADDWTVETARKGAVRASGFAWGNLLVDIRLSLSGLWRDT